MMTDKEQIMIDGVDVSGCDFFIKNRDKQLCRCIKVNSFGDIVNPKNAENSNCLDNYNCYYKQRVRKTHELEVICKAFDIEYAYDDDGKIYGRSNKLRSLEQECEELKEKYKNVLDLAKQNADANEYCLQELEQENYRYRKALEEIEGLVQNVEADECPYGDFDCNNCDSDNSCSTKVKRLILDIISRAKEG